jgi:hypothetical protein
MAAYLIHGELSVQAVKDSLELILGGPYTLAFWLLFMGLGLLAPLILEVWEVAPAMEIAELAGIDEDVPQNVPTEYDQHTCKCGQPAVVMERRLGSQ